ncbi:MAG TPA: glycosyl hydrolase, partial [Candidatus Dormibacteraeota bacterium]|nr:glycosyl hydrolase [Candidatus Dormibacteraeota bacterium]
MKSKILALLIVLGMVFAFGLIVAPGATPRLGTNEPQGQNEPVGKKLPVPRVLSPRSGSSGEALEQAFAHPPDSARPWVYWFWLNGSVSSNGITADLEAMKRVGIGGVLIMEVDQGTPKGPADFGRANWRELFKHVCAEAGRLGLEVNMNNDAGWCGSGGPWITPALSMQKLVFTETNVSGPAHFEANLPHPQVLSNYYGEVALFAYPTPKDDARIEAVRAKAAFTPDILPGRTGSGNWPSDAVVPMRNIIDLSAKLRQDGTLIWDVPRGKWTLLRIGHTTTGKDNHPAPEPGRGLESDKLSKEATDVMFAGLMGKLSKDSKPLAGKTLVATHIDSWETGSQNWTPRFREEFRKLRGYDLWKYLPVISGRVVESAEVSERFLWDLRQTVSDLLLRNYAGRFRELAHREGLRLSIEAYGAPCDEMKYAAEADEPMAEFWARGYNGAYSCTEMASAAHVYGKRILGAEAFTSTEAERWLLYPGALKGLGDWAFCEGINRFVFHRYALQPWDDVAPGISMGPWGLHYERTQTWWEESGAWHEYLARCQALLQQGLFVADLCYLQPEDSPERFTLVLPGTGGNTPDRAGYNFDGCSADVVLHRMKVKDGKLVLPDGMTYRMLVLPEVETMTPKLLERIGDLVKAGATIIGPPPTKSPSLADYPTCDAEVRRLTAGLWGDTKEKPDKIERHVGKGTVIFGRNYSATATAEAPNRLKRARWIWHAEGDPLVAAPVGKRYFQRVIALRKGIQSGQLAITADNSFEVWLNGQRVGAGENFKEVFQFDVSKLLRTGTNMLSVEAVNGADKPNPAGLIASLLVRFNDGTEMELRTDRSWQSAEVAPENWKTKGGTNSWQTAMELGAYNLPPWNLTSETAPPYQFPPYSAITNTLANKGVAPDFDSQGAFRYIHKRIEGMDFYFVANPATNSIGAQCAFRITRRAPELWDPMSGAIKPAPVYEEKNGQTVMPLWLEPMGSVFVVFKQAQREPTQRGFIGVKRDGKNVLPEDEPIASAPPLEFIAQGDRLSATVLEPGRYELIGADGRQQKLQVDSLPKPIEITGPWEITFQRRLDCPDKVVFTN